MSKQNGELGNIGIGTFYSESLDVYDLDKSNRLIGEINWSTKLPNLSCDLGIY